MATAQISRWARRYLLASAMFLVAGHAALLVSAPRVVVVTLGLYGFVLTTVFGKAYSLVPAYFDRTLAWARAPQVQFPLTVGGVVLLALAGADIAADTLYPVGAIAWASGVVVFLGTLAATIRDNPTGAATGTGEANASRAPLDRFANVFVPIVLLYLATATYELVASATALPTLLGGNTVRIAHLLGPGVGVLALLAIGYRLLPRFLSATPTRLLAAVVLPAGALGPALLAWGYPAGVVFRVGAVSESIAVVGFAIAVFELVARSDKSRVGFYGPVVGGVLGCLGVGLGLYFAFEGIDPRFVQTHLQLNVFGLLGVSIVGVVYQFYPPAVAPWPGAGDRTALASIAGLGVGLGLAAVAPLFGQPLAIGGHLLTLVSAGMYAYILSANIMRQK